MTELIFQHFADAVLSVYAGTDLWGHVYIAMPPLYSGNAEKRRRGISLKMIRRLKNIEGHTKTVYFQRYKGLGEMDEQMGTTLDPKRRLLSLLRLKMREWLRWLRCLWEQEVPPRRAFIYENARRNLIYNLYDETESTWFVSENGLALCHMSKMKWRRREMNSESQIIRTEYSDLMKNHILIMRWA